MRLATGVVESCKHIRNAGRATVTLTALKAGRLRPRMLGMALTVGVGVPTTGDVGVWGRGLSSRAGEAIGDPASLET